MDILIINLLMVLNSVLVNYELYRRNYNVERCSLQYHWTAAAAAAAAATADRYSVALHISK